MPSTSPTISCDFLVVGVDECIGYPTGDVLFILDSSTSISGDEFKNFTSRVADRVEDNFPNDGSRLAILQYATDYIIELNFDDTTEPDVMAFQIRNYFFFVFFKNKFLWQKEVLHYYSWTLKLNQNWFLFKYFFFRPKLDFIFQKNFVIQFFNFVYILIWLRLVRSEVGIGSV